MKKLNEAYKQLRKKYQKPEIGKTIDVSGIKWLVLDKLEKGYLVISDDFYGKSRKFDADCNNWGSSDMRQELNTELRRKIEEAVGEGRLSNSHVTYYLWMLPDRVWFVRRLCIAYFGG